MTLTVRSHVARDLLQSSEMFKNERLVIWEYVSNGLDYVDPGTSPLVRVRLDNKGKRIVIEDNGRGMDYAGLENFFFMHGENIDRKHGRPGRGRFGTGKSAAFGIADTMRITTVKDGKRSQVELSRGDLEAAGDGDPVPVRTLANEEATEAPNGTMVEIEGVQLRSLDQPGVIAYIERHLAHWPKDVLVFVNNHQCEFAEPPVERVESFTPTPEQAAVIGEVRLDIKVSKSPLDEDLRGISIFANGVWHETTLLGSDRKEMAEFMFGEIDVPALDTDKSMPSAFDASRSMRLNPGNPLVSAIYEFIGPKLEAVRKELAEAQREQRASEEAKRLRREAEKIEEILNDDFASFRKRLQKIRAAAAKSGFDAADVEPSGNGVGDDDFLYGGEEPAAISAPDGESGQQEGNGGGGGGEPRRLNPIVEPDAQGNERGHGEKRQGERPRSRGGFSVEFVHQGADQGRAVYSRDKRIIYVNLDHPQIAAAHTHGIEDPVFRRLAYEVAFSEYAIALAVELDSRQEYADPLEAITEIRDTVHRIARAAAPLYA